MMELWTGLYIFFILPCLAMTQGTIACKIRGWVKMKYEMFMLKYMYRKL